MQFDAFAACYDFCSDSEWPSGDGAGPGCMYGTESVYDDLYGCYVGCGCLCMG
jgi:hypothetical protein